MKDIVYFNNKVQSTIDKYPENVTERINFELTALQAGHNNAFEENEVHLEDANEQDLEEANADNIYTPAQHKSMRETIGRHARQITIKSIDSYRVIYIAKFDDAIYVLHSFKKKTEGTSKRDYTPAVERYKQVEEHIREEKKRTKKK